MTDIFEDLIIKLDDKYKQQIKQNEDLVNRVSELELALKSKDDKIIRFEKLANEMTNCVQKNNRLHEVTDKMNYELKDKDVFTKWKYSSEKGYLHVIEWLHENGIKGCTTDTMDLAARGGHLDLVKWLHENRTEGCTTRAMDLAAMNGHIEVFKWLHKNRNEGFSKSAMRLAAENGHLEVVTLIFNMPRGRTLCADWFFPAQWYKENCIPRLMAHCATNKARGFKDMDAYDYIKDYIQRV